MDRFLMRGCSVPPPHRRGGPFAQRCTFSHQPSAYDTSFLEPSWGSKGRACGPSGRGTQQTPTTTSPQSVVQSSFQALDLYWGSPELGDFWYKLRTSKKTISSPQRAAPPPRVTRIMGNVPRLVGGGDRIHPENDRRGGQHGVQYVAQCVACAALTLVVWQ